MGRYGMLGTGREGSQTQAAPPGPLLEEGDPSTRPRRSRPARSSVTKCLLREGTKGTAQEVTLNLTVPTSFVQRLRGAWQACSRCIGGNHTRTHVCDLRLAGGRPGREGGRAPVFQDAEKTPTQMSALSRKRAR